MWLSTCGKRERAGKGSTNQLVAGIHRNVQIDYWRDVEIIGSSIFKSSNCWDDFLPPVGPSLDVCSFSRAPLRQLEELREQRRQVEEELRKVGP